MPPSHCMQVSMLDITDSGGRDSGVVSWRTQRLQPTPIDVGEQAYSWNTASPRTNRTGAQPELEWSLCSVVGRG